VEFGPQIEVGALSTRDFIFAEFVTALGLLSCGDNLKRAVRKSRFPSVYASFAE